MIIFNRKLFDPPPSEVQIGSERYKWHEISEGLFREIKDKQSRFGLESILVSINKYYKGREELVILKRDDRDCLL